jgi:hypothetical protein
MPRMLKRNISALTVGLFGLATLLVTTAGAEIRGNAYTITATSNEGTATYSIPAPTAEDYYWSWSTTERIEMRDPVSGNLVATLNPNNEGCSVNYVADPIIGLGFTVQAGPLPTVFSFSSGTLAFAAIPAAEGRASAAYTVTDLTGDGATLAPNLGAKSYHASYNGGIAFADLVGPFAAGVFSSSTLSESNPAGPGFLPIGVPVTSMDVAIDFVLSPFDLASGTTVFVIQQRAVPVEGTTWSGIKSLME